MTKRGFLWIPVMLVTGIFVSFRGGTVSYLLFYTALGFPLLSFLYLLYVYSGFRVYQKIGAWCVKKEEEVPYEFLLSNEAVRVSSFIKVSFLMGAAVPEEGASDVPVCLLPGETCRKETQMRCRYRGEYHAGIDRIVVEDFLGMFRISYHIPTPLSVTVQPRLIELSSFAGELPETAGKEQHRPGERPETADLPVREYQNGDPLRQIHWKATARSRKPMVRTLKEEPRRRVLLFFDRSLYEPQEHAAKAGLFAGARVPELVRLEAEDKMVEAVLALAAYYLSRGSDAELFFWDEEPVHMSVRNRRELDALYEYFCHMHFAEIAASHLTELLDRAVRLGYGGSRVILAWNHCTGLGELVGFARITGEAPVLVLIGGAPDEKPGYEDPKLRVIRAALGEDVKECLMG